MASASTPSVNEPTKAFCPHSKAKEYIIKEKIELPI